MKKILVPLDGSHLAEKVLPYAVQLAAEFKAEVTLLRVVKGGQDNDRLATEYLEQVRKVLVEATQVENQAVRLMVEQELGSPVVGENLPFTASNQLAHGQGQVHKQIIQVAQQIKADLIAMSTHGRSGIGRVFSGSVPQHVLHETNLPMMLIHPHDEEQSLAETFRNTPPDFVHRTVVIPLDGRPIHEAALPIAKEIALAGRARLALLRIISDMPDALAMAGAVTATGGMIGDPITVEDLEQDAREYLADVRKNQLSELAAVDLKVLTGKANAEILHFVEKRSAGFVVMATHARTGLGGAILGSVTDDLISHIKNHPLLVIHPRS